MTIIKECQKITLEFGTTNQSVARLCVLATALAVLAVFANNDGAAAPKRHAAAAKTVFDLTCTFKGGVSDGKTFDLRIASRAKRANSDRAGFDFLDGRYSTPYPNPIHPDAAWAKIEYVEFPPNKVVFGFNVQRVLGSDKAVWPAGPGLSVVIDRRSGSFERQYNGDLSVGACVALKSVF